RHSREKPGRGDVDRIPGVIATKNLPSPLSYLDEGPQKVNCSHPASASREGNAHMPTSATPEHVIRQIVETMRTLAGPHPGFRPVHAKGLVCSGTFRASAEAPRVTRAPHFTGFPVPPIVRLANANGNPNWHDGVPNMRSMGVKFKLSAGKRSDVLATSFKGVITGTPE